MWKPLCFVGAMLMVAQAFGQTTTPAIPRPGQSGQPGNAGPAQGQPQNTQPGARQTANYRGPGEMERGAVQQVDPFVAACLTLGNEEEVALGKLATEKAQNAQVKQFARQMVEVHTQAISQLQRFAPKGISLKLSQREEGAAQRTNQGAERIEQPQRQPATERPQTGYAAGQPQQPVQAQPGQPQAAGQPGEQMAGGIEHSLLSIQREAKQQCLAMTEDELQRQRGEEFDKCYIGQQLGAHIQMLAILQAAERHVSPELQKIVEQQRQTAEQHLQHVRQLQQELTRSETAASPGRTTR